MKSLAIIAVMALAAGTALADPILGSWRSSSVNGGYSGLIQIAPCGDAICGVLVKSFDANGKEVPYERDGRYIIWDTENKGGGVYRGRVFSPEHGRSYASKLVLSGNRLSVSGCIAIVCREGAVWARQ